MARSRITLPVTPAAAPETLAEATARYVAAQARDAIASGMGMSEFFRWGVSYTMDRIGLGYSEGQSIVIGAWSVAFDEHRASELDAMEQETSTFWFAREKHYNSLASACAKQDDLWQQHRRDAYQCGRRARDIQDLYGR